ncbi:hypothetical protein ABW20_dc0106189 [Dactylellina cionopaga]|nr:hypothetical protein ABW20_dc0106189 [Dactylellina cionopaga]
MQIKTIAAILALVPSIAGHAFIQDAWGDVDSSIRGYGIGVKFDTPRQNQVRYVGLIDTAVFSSPTIQNDACKSCPSYQATCAKCRSCKKNPKYTAAAHKKNPKLKATTCSWIKACKKCPKYNANCAKCRTKLESGCGRTFFVDPASTLYNMDPKPVAPKKCCGYDKATKGQWGNYGKGALNVKEWISKAAGEKRIPLVRPGGYLMIGIYQINADGAGPYTCTIDQSGTGNSFDSAPLKVLSNVQGKNWKGKETFTNTYKFTNWTVPIQLPDNLKCTGTFGGKSNICVVRCRNGAPNGPFGGCVPIQQCTGSKCPGGAPEPAPAPQPPAPAQDSDLSDDQVMDLSTDEELPDDAIEALQGYGETDDTGDSSTDSTSDDSTDSTDT